MKYPLSNPEKVRLLRAMAAVFSIPFIDDVEDYIWEAVFCYTKKITLTDPLTAIRSKRLFDVVDIAPQIGWSAKALQCTISPGSEFEIVIQRADIFKKAEELGFRALSKSSSPEMLGSALYKHWYGTKVKTDAVIQGVKDKRVCILLKSRDRKQFAYIEDDIAEYKENELEWRWTDSSKTGLQGTDKTTGWLVFRWYPNQKQLFERFKIPENVFIFSLIPSRLSLDVVIDSLLEKDS